MPYPSKPSKPRSKDDAAALAGGLRGLSMKRKKRKKSKLAPAGKKARRALSKSKVKAAVRAGAEPVRKKKQSLRETTRRLGQAMAGARRMRGTQGYIRDKGESDTHLSRRMTKHHANSSPSKRKKGNRSKMRTAGKIAAARVSY